MLLVNAGRVLPFHELYAEIWPDGLPADPANALQVHLVRLRRQLESGEPGRELRITTAGPGLSLSLEPGELDLEVFSTCWQQARHLVRSEPRTAAEKLREARALEWARAGRRARPQPAAQGPWPSRPKRTVSR
ncbi:DNA-binding SARP family transcriptional activator [Actinopolyspora biskrensis]|uniref:DNA-binding SARP family transcriptional activator n=2 Tax=Actinopolyspora biskrensis TaxID=1470178 RepID=A0A852YTR0_9ACTN|nr:helix-turn-helix domain-containing protein [Actinopolyspora biskrensis]NYH77480.1 DNA-binding SARP family transcriptional activator [Actinopolyspora biskrensis]